MANPFKDNAKQPKKAPVGAQEPQKEAEVISVPVEPVVPVEAAEKPTEQTADILAGLNSKKPAKKAYGYYLSEESAKKLERAAKAQKVSVSKLLDHIIQNLDI